MSNKTKIILAVTAMLTAFAFGRFSAPEKIKIQTKIAETEKKVDTVKTDTDRDKHKETVTVVVAKPDGTTTTTTTAVEDDKTTRKTDSKDTDQTALTETQTKEITKGGSPTTIAAVIAIPLSLNASTPAYGLSVYKGVLGPIGIGVGGFTNGTVNASVGLTF